MPSTSKKISAILLLTTAPMVSHSDTLCAPKIETINEKGIIGSYECHNNKKKYTLRNFSDRDNYGILAQKNLKKSFIEKTRQPYNPAPVDMAWATGFLPIEYQAFLKNNRVIYIFTKRSTSNGFNGQCGSGSETYLGIINLSQPTPKKEWSHIISSCIKSIVTKGSDVNHLIDAISHSENNLQVHWDFFNKDEDKTGTIEIIDGKISFKITDSSN